MVSWTVLGGVLRAAAPNIDITEGGILYVGIDRHDAPGWGTMAFGSEKRSAWPVMSFSSRDFSSL